VNLGEIDFEKLKETFATSHKRTEAEKLDIETFFQQLLEFTQELNAEDQRAVGAGLTEEELALFDLLTKPQPKLTPKQEAEVKGVCKGLLEKLKAEKLVLDWRGRQQARAAVRQTIEIVLDQLPEVYDEEIFSTKCDLAYRHVHDSYFGGGRSIYASI
jgi:type I restriction enzyme, R subunit